MKIAFYNIFGELKNAEQETLLRLEYCFKKQGHELYVIDRNGFVISSGKYHGKYIEDISVDFLFTYNTLEKAIKTFPDVFSVFFHWSPLGFVANFQTLLSIKYFNVFDHFASTYEQDVFYRIDRITHNKIPFIGSSVPANFALPARKHTDRKLFYVGVNFERKLINMRYGDLFKKLDQSNRIEIYGPKTVYGVSNLWAGFDCYKGEIPFDGRSILKKINQAGVCLAINSPMHNDANGVSNRTYEGAAAGALIISDDNEFVRHYFKDSVFYLDRRWTEDECANKILEVLDWANKHPDKAYEMADRSNKIFLEHLALDRMVKETVSNISDTIKLYNNKDKQQDLIDVICFVNSPEDYKIILQQIEKQYYQNLHLILITDEHTYKKIKKSDKYFHSLAIADSEYKGKSFYKAIPLLKGRYFMFMDVYSTLHKRHIYKNLDVLKNFDVLFSYSGCYIHGQNYYITLSSRPILRDEFLFFSQAHANDWHYKDIQSFFIETIFSRSGALFSRDILSLTTEGELSHISESVHYYLACCSIIKANKLGRFTHTCTSGYSASSLEEVNQKVFSHRKHWHSNCRSAKTYIKEMNEVFFKYTFETTPYFVPSRDLRGEDLWFSTGGAEPLPEDEKLWLFIAKHWPVKVFMDVLTCGRRKHHPQAKERCIVYLKKHYKIKKFLNSFAKKEK